MTTSPRTSYQELGKMYFWTATINGWKHLLADDNKKEIIRQSLIHLSERGLIDVYGYVMMPNHVHAIWKMNKLNGKEMPSGSLLKFTAHKFKKTLSEKELTEFRVVAGNKTHEFWQRDSMAIELFTPEVAWQKLDYIHNNPLAEKWSLVKDPCEYTFSSAGFYLDQASNQGFLHHLGNVIG